MMKETNKKERRGADSIEIRRYGVERIKTIAEREETYEPSCRWIAQAGWTGLTTG